MLVANILATLEQASLSKAVMTVQSVNGTPSLILSFIADGATVTDSQKVMELRKTLAQPLVVTGQDLEQQLIEHLGHSADELISVTSDLKKEQSAKTKTQPKKTKAASGKAAATPKSPETTATSQEPTQADQTPAPAKEPAQDAAQQVSQISMSDFSL